MLGVPFFCGLKNNNPALIQHQLSPPPTTLQSLTVWGEDDTCTPRLARGTWSLAIEVDRLAFRFMLPILPNPASFPFFNPVFVTQGFGELVQLVLEHVLLLRF